MLDTDTKRRIDTARDILVGKVPDPPAHRSSSRRNTSPLAPLRTARCLPHSHECNHIEFCCRIGGQISWLLSEIADEGLVE